MTGAGSRRTGLAGFLLSGAGWPYLLVPFILIAIVLKVVHASPTLVFVSSALGVVPTAALMGRATEELAERSGPGIGGLLNVTFGNAPEIIIALFALGRGLHEVVKASLIGSVLGNILLVLGAAMLVGGLRHRHQRFDANAAGSQSAILFLGAAALLMPAVYVLVEHGHLPAPGAEIVDYTGRIETLSLVLALVLIAVYGAFLWFSLRTHRDLFNPDAGKDVAAAGEKHAPWSVRRSVGALAIAGVAVAGMSELLVGSITDAAKSVGLSEFFIAAIVVAIVGNAAEHWVAVLVAAKNKMDLAVNIAIGSSAQIALFALPLLVVISFVLGPHPMAMVFNGFELAAVAFAVLIANLVTHEGSSTWFEGLVLLGVYAVLGTAFAFAT